MSHFNVAGTAPASRLAEWHNRLQAEAEATRLGIPVTLSSDWPRRTSRARGSSSASPTPAT
jgi:beta-glucosidase